VICAEGPGRERARIWLVLAAIVLCAPARAGEPETVSAPAAAAEDAEPLTAREIYRRVLTNRFASFIQDTSMTSADRGGRHMVTRLQMHWRDFREGQRRGDGDVLSKTLVKYSHPFEIRHSGYLVIHNSRRANDQFVYFPTRRKVMRVTLRSENVYGTDFSFEDILPRELQDAEYERFEDSVVSGIPTFTIEAIPNEFADSEYSRFVIQVDKERWVSLHARYWNDAGVEVKEMEVDPVAVKDFGGVWVPMRITMRTLQTESSTTLEVTHLEPNPEIPRATFAVQRLEAH
jgi:hypothetical protein